MTASTPSPREIIRKAVLDMNAAWYRGEEPTEDAVDAVFAALAAHDLGIMPRDPTEAMIEAGNNIDDAGYDALHIYCAMWDAYAHTKGGNE